MGEGEQERRERTAVYDGWWRCETLEDVEEHERLVDRCLYVPKKYRHLHGGKTPERLGGVPVSDLTAEDLDHLYARLSREGVGVRTINHAIARVALQRAVKRRLIPYNPAKDADLPRYSTAGRKYAVMSWGGA